MSWRQKQSSFQKPCLLLWEHPVLASKSVFVKNKITWVANQNLHLYTAQVERSYLVPNDQTNVDLLQIIPSLTKVFCCHVSQTANKFSAVLLKPNTVQINPVHCNPFVIQFIPAESKEKHPSKGTQQIASNLDFNAFPSWICRRWKWRR